MQTVEALQVYEVGKRGKPVEIIGPGDLAEPYHKSAWQRVVEIAKAVVEVARETRALEKRMLGRAHYRRLGEY